MAICIMIVMVLRGVWITRNQMEAEAERSIRSASAAMAGMIAAGGAQSAGSNAILRALAPAHVDLRLEPALDRKPAAPEALTGKVRVERSEPPRDCRRPFGLSYAAMGASSSMA